MEHTVYSTDLDGWPTYTNNEAKEYCAKKGSST